MHLAILQFDVLIHDAQSLKDKRSVVSSLKARLHREHLVAIAEVALHDVHHAARMALAIISCDGRHAGQSLDGITTHLRTQCAHLGAELGEVRRSVIDAGELDELAMPDDVESPKDDATSMRATNPEFTSLAQEMLARGLSMENPS